MRKLGLAFVCAALAATAARAADQRDLQRLQAPAPAEVRRLPEAGRAIRLVRVVVDLRPEPWAYVKRYIRVGEAFDLQERLISWQDGKLEIKTSAVSKIFDEELARAGGVTDAASGRLFDSESSADLVVGVQITEMLGRFCNNCSHFRDQPDRWNGAVLMKAHWEIYSTLDRKTLASIDTNGGYETPKDGVDGTSDRLVNEAFRDAARRLIASDDFRRIITAAGDLGPKQAPHPNTSLIYAPSQSATPLSQATHAVAIVYASDGQGSGFLIGREGYMLTNQHVVGGSKFVKVKWSEGGETLGEVVRSDRRRDVALLKVDPQGHAPLALRPAETRQGETVFAIGTPLDDSYQNTMTRGIVSATRTMDGLPFIQSDVAINHGNSGGPLLDEKGQVIGITVLGVLPGGASTGLNFFIPIDDALRALSLAPAAAPALPPAKVVTRPGRPKR